MGGSHLVVAVGGSVAGEAEGGPGEGAAAAQHDGSQQAVLLHIPELHLLSRRTGLLQQGGPQLGAGAESEGVDR